MTRQTHLPREKTYTHVSPKFFKRINANEKLPNLYALKMFEIIVLACIVSILSSERGQECQNRPSKGLLFMREIMLQCQPGSIVTLALTSSLQLEALD